MLLAGSSRTQRRLGALVSLQGNLLFSINCLKHLRGYISGCVKNQAIKSSCEWFTLSAAAMSFGREAGAKTQVGHFS